MAWPPTPLPINFQNATVSLDTHPTAHNATNLQLNTDVIPEINRLRNFVGDGTTRTFSIDIQNEGAGGVPLPGGTGHWTQDANIVTCWAAWTIVGDSQGPGIWVVNTTGLPAVSGLGVAVRQPLGQLSFYNGSPQPFSLLLANAEPTFFGVSLDGYEQRQILNGHEFRATFQYLTQP